MMKIYILDKHSRTAVRIIAPLVLVLLIIINVLVPVKSTFANTAQLIAVTVVLSLFTLLYCVTITVALIYECASVIIDSQGVTLINGKLILKYIAWEQVKRIEKVYAPNRGIGYVLIILTRYKESRAFRRGSFLGLSAGKHYIAIPYSKKAADKLKKCGDIYVCRK